jgi:hypothetical protein
MTPKTPSCVTVVPVYKERPNKTEALSLLQLRLLDVENVVLMCPEGLDLDIYQSLLPELMIERFPKRHFLSVQTYNDFLLGPQFYETFLQKYEWMLIYQLDAFLLSNRIEHFCQLGYDYYGAPWTSGFPQYHFLFDRWPIRINTKRFLVGNGGLSLRNIKNTVDLLKEKQGHITKAYFMEDAFFGYWGSLESQFRACPPKIAATFSLEMDPEYWMSIGGLLPMGFHGFERRSQSFYNPILKEKYQHLLKSFPQETNNL